ncbi:sialidase-3-like [Protopterus annectens]|uniref:sialidase-3-like n=1 Tax=Protopterus annectens TaxID=7888 RepID=UPI001CF93CB1|nr:sialidase-3-like [Protopterus annectens]XP_043928605.1 sialidase-3-like [Protopterus annectens]
MAYGSLTNMAVPEKTILFQQEPDGTTYRIPSLIFIKSTSTFLAFAEQRSSPDDADAKCLVMRQGHQNGNSVQWDDMRVMSDAQLQGYRTMNPCPVFDEDEGVLFLFFVCIKKHVTECWQLFTGKNAAKLCYITSKDHGKTWSRAIDLTEDVIGDEIVNWATFAVGPGHGIQLESGRLIIPAYTYYIYCPSCFCGFNSSKPHSFTFYSDDHGNTWQMGKLIDNIKTVECEMAEIKCQSGMNVLYCSSRTPLHYRAEAFSQNEGNEFVGAILNEKLVEPPSGCQGSVISFQLPEKYTLVQEEKHISMKETTPVIDCSGSHPDASLSWLLFSHPTSKEERLDLGIYLNQSPLDASKWSSPWIINFGPSGYSDLVNCEGKFACLFECSDQSIQEIIAFTVFTYSDLKKGIKI